MEIALTGLKNDGARILFKPWIAGKSWIAMGVYFFQAVRQGLRLIRRPIHFPPMYILPEPFVGEGSSRT
ncbi:MAG: hypothetical protein U9Q05_01720 [Thermodesulfobacteriota bacterium]|nr:hypothetical protein [Thermodesulfobacteriota bacterium]